jgi:hypothetical protein
LGRWKQFNVKTFITGYCSQEKKNTVILNTTPHTTVTGVETFNFVFQVWTASGIHTIFHPVNTAGKTAGM